MDDPETEWDVPELEVPPIALSPDDFVVLEPGEDPEIWAELPKERHLQFGLAARTGQLVLCSGRRRTWLRMGNGVPPDHVDAPVRGPNDGGIHRHRSRGRRTRPKEYLVFTDSFGRLVGWLDYSDRWTFNARLLRQIAAAGGLHYDVQRFDTESEFEQSHPDWVR